MSIDDEDEVDEREDEPGDRLPAGEGDRGRAFRAGREDDEEPDDDDDLPPAEPVRAERVGGAILRVAASAGAAISVEGVLEPQRPQVKVYLGPELPDRRRSPVLLREPESERAASFRVLRHRLADGGDPRTIAVTSAEPKEGKSLCAVNLALALAESGRARVLLVEANLRSPSLAELFGFTPPECFADQLRKHRDRPVDPWSVVEIISTSLHVAAVSPTYSGRPLLDGPAFAFAMEMLQRAGYDYIVVDTPAVLTSADVNLVEECVDGVLLTTWSGRSKARSVRRAIEQLSPKKVLGLMLLQG